MIDQFIHKWFRVPYTLHVRTFRRVKRPAATILFIHGIGNNGAAWKEVVELLPADVRVVAVDLLGFGQSPRPEWAIYDAKRQATSVLATYLKLRLAGRVIIVGHSLGALVAIEIAKRYPLLVKHLILCSPPFYRSDDTPEKLPRHPDAVLRRIYKQAERYPDKFIILANFVTKYKLINKTFSVTSDNLHSYIGTLRATILNQTSLDDAMKLTIPTDLICGSLDPVVIKKNLKTLVKANPNMKLKTIIAGHEVQGLFVPAVASTIAKAIVD